MTDTPTTEDIRNYIHAMRRAAIQRLTEGRDDMGVYGQITEHGNLTCTATPARVTGDGEQLYQTAFAINGMPITQQDAERIAMGEPLDAPSHLR